MNEEFNPYAAPQAEIQLVELADSEPPTIWRDGRFIVIPHGALVPPRCWRCNSASIEGQWKCQLTWFPPLLLLLLLLGVVPLLIAILFVQHRSAFMVSLCPEHARKRRWHLLIAWTIGLAGFASILFGALASAREPGPFIGIGILSLIVGSVYGGIMANLASPRRIDKHVARVTGAGRAFRDSLPDAMGQVRPATG